MIRFTVIGGGSEIGANCFLVGSNGTSVLLDCGVHPKKLGPAALPDLAALREPPEAVMVSHGHIDHCGALPCLLRLFPETQVYATQPTVRIMDRMLHNSVSVMGMVAREQGVQGYPLYQHEDVDHVVRRAYGMEFDHEFALDFGSRARGTFRHAGHVLGSASIVLRVPDHTLFYTGDICMTRQELMHGHRLVDNRERVDTLVIECTRGAQGADEDTTYDEETERFAREVRKVLLGGGSVLVPSFALGRSQEILNLISRLMRSGRLPTAPVYASGLGRAVYELYVRYSRYLSPDADLRPLHEFHCVGDVWDPRVARKLVSKPGIVVATSGMMLENTPSAMLASVLVRENCHGIFFVGYLDPDTLGYRLLHANTGDALAFELGGALVKVALENRQMFRFSAHAGRDDLRALVDHLRPSNVVFVHGDPEAVQWMSANCNGDSRKYTPVLGETLSLGA